MPKHADILILMLNQMRSDFTPMESHPYVQMPTIEALAANGVYFRDQEERRPGNYIPINMGIYAALAEKRAVQAGVTIHYHEIVTAVERVDGAIVPDQRRGPGLHLPGLVERQGRFLRQDCRMSMEALS